jgi:hypothetical protein
MSGNIVLSLVMATDNCYFLESFFIRLLNIHHQPAKNHVAWAVSNLCRGKPAPVMELISPAIKPLASLLHKDVSTDCLIDVVWALSYIADGSNEKIERVMSTGVTAKLIEFLEDKSLSLLLPTICCLGNFVAGSDLQTQAVIDAGVLNHLTQVLDSSSVRLLTFFYTKCLEKRLKYF